MSLLPKESIKVIAESAGIIAMPDEIAGALASDVEYRIREIAQVIRRLAQWCLFWRLNCSLLDRKQ